MTFHPTMKRRLHERLHPLIGEEEADALLDEISPPDPITREWVRGELEPFVTKDHLDLRLEGLEGRLRGEMGELRGEMGELRGELRGEMGELRGEMGELRGEIGKLDAKMAERFRQHTIVTVVGLGGAATIISIVQAIWG